MIEHGAGVDLGAVFATKQFAGFEENRCAGFPRHGGPHVMGIKGCLNRFFDVRLGCHVNSSDDVAVIVRHDLFNNIACEDFLAVDDAWDFDDF